MANHTNNCKIYIWRENKGSGVGSGVLSNKELKNKINTGEFTAIAWEKYNIKETDMRIKTASLTTPQYIDLTTGVYHIFIASKYHENFIGTLLDVEFDEDNGLYTYKIQDMSREYISKMQAVFTPNQKMRIYDILRYCLTLGSIKTNKPTANQLETWKQILSGLRPIDYYNQTYWKGNIIGGNFMTQTPSMVIRNKSYIEVIRDLIWGNCQYVDIYFNNAGILQIEPFSRDDWINTGLVLSDGSFASRNLKFDTTNAITGVNIEGTKLKTGTTYNSKKLTGLDLSMFFGNIVTEISNPIDKSTTVKTTTTKTKSTASTKKTTSNPYGNKKKTVWINADNGSGAKKEAIAKELRKRGWKVHVGATDSNAHYRDYWNVTKDYQCYITLYNGFCAGTVREAYSSKIQNALKKKGVVLVIMWDSNDWTNPKGMKPYRYGDFTKYNAKRAWDDNFSSSDPSIKSVGDWLKKRNAKYCVHPTTSGICDMFEAGGYFASKGK